MTDLVMNLVPGQFQIGNRVIGKGTTVYVEEFKWNEDDINAQDFQMSRNDEMEFGQDQLKPTTVEFTFHVQYNWLLPHYAGLIPNFWAEMPKISEFVKIWKAEAIRKTPQAQMPIYFMGSDGVQKMFYGRPGKYKAGSTFSETETVEFQGEFRRNDTQCYTAQERWIPVVQGADPAILFRESGPNGDATAWCRVVLEGPITNPVITIGDQQVKLDIELAEGETAEISSYPWSRRAVNNRGQNLAPLMIGDTEYLDRLVLPLDVDIPVRWTSDETNSWVPAVGNQDLSYSINGFGFYNLPDTFAEIHGKVRVELDVFNQPQWFQKYLNAGLFESTSAVVYTGKKYNTPAQYVEARIVNPALGGRSMLTFMGDLGMTNFAGLEIQADIFGGNYLRIRSGTAYNATTSRAQWHYTDHPVWPENTLIGIGYDPETETYQGYINREPIDDFTWQDTGGAVVNTGSLNRYQGFIFDLDGNLLSQGVGFREIFAYDRAVVPEATGSVYLLWHDTWNGPSS